MGLRGEGRCINRGSGSRAEYFRRRETSARIGDGVDWLRPLDSERSRFDITAARRSGYLLAAVCCIGGVGELWLWSSPPHGVSEEPVSDERASEDSRGFGVEVF